MLTTYFDTARFGFVQDCDLEMGEFLRHSNYYRIDSGHCSCKCSRFLQNSFFKICFKAGGTCPAGCNIGHCSCPSDFLLVPGCRAGDLSKPE